jgi:hypothetical protein
MSETDTNNLLTVTNATPNEQDTTNSTLKSSSISQSSSYSSIKSGDDEFPSQTTTTTATLADKKKSVDAPKPQRVNITLNLLPQKLVVHSSTSLKHETPATADIKSTKRPTTTRYTKEFLEKVRRERSKFIDQICPDIFRAYCYCMNGKYWNPEKYFDVVQHQFPEELDKIKRFNNKKPYNNVQQKTYQKKANVPYQQKPQHEDAGKIILDLIKPKQSISPTSIFEQLLPPKTPDRTSTGVQQQKQHKSNISSLFTAPAPPPPTPASNLLDMLHAANKNKQQHANTAAYKNLINLFDKETSKQSQQQQNENLIKKLFDQNRHVSTQKPTEHQVAAAAPTSFPTINPHELPFQSIDYALNQILKSTSPSEASSSTSSNSSSISNSVSSSNTTSPHKVFDSLIEKLKTTTTEKQTSRQSNTEHFNLLLSKIQKTSQQQHQQPPSSQTTDILKWFKQQPQPTTSQQQHSLLRLPENAHVFALRDIESAF